MILVPNPFLSFFLPAYSLFFSLCREKKRKGSKFLWKKKKIEEREGENRNLQKPFPPLCFSLRSMTIGCMDLNRSTKKKKKDLEE